MSTVRRLLFNCQVLGWNTIPPVDAWITRRRASCRPGILLSLGLASAVLLVVPACSDAAPGDAGATPEAGSRVEAAVSAVDPARLEELTLEPGVSALALSATNPGAAELRRDRTPADVAPTRDEIRIALELLQADLARRGLDGGLTLWPGWGFSYRGPAPGFPTYIDVDVYPAVEGTLELVARRELAAYSLIEEDLPPDTPSGRVWIGDGLAYGHNSGQDPDEWVAVVVGQEMFLVRAFHSGGADRLLGVEGFVAVARSVIEQVREVGLTGDAVASSPALASTPGLAAKMHVALVTRCEDICGPVSLRTVQD